MLHVPVYASYEVITFLSVDEAETDPSTVIVKSSVSVALDGGCDADMEDPTTETYLLMKRDFLIFVSLLNIL